MAVRRVVACNFETTVPGGFQGGHMHHCHAIGCHREIPPRRFMCRQHWYALPRHYQQAIWRHYRPGQERAKDPSDEYRTVARDAINWLSATSQKGR
jgi:hypothetical protein